MAKWCGEGAGEAAGARGQARSCGGGPGRGAGAVPPEAPAGSAAAPLGASSPRTKQKALSACLAFWVPRLATPRIRVLQSSPPLVS